MTWELTDASDHFSKLRIMGWCQYGKSSFKKLLEKI
jgi:hypothetical protein